MIFSHSTKHYSILGGLVADAKKYKSGEIPRDYEKHLMEGLRLTATIRKNTNVLQHMMGYFKDRLTADEKLELIETIAIPWGFRPNHRTDNASHALCAQIR